MQEELLLKRINSIFTDIHIALNAFNPITAGEDYS